MTYDNGGPAFPPTTLDARKSGMTLLDWFAAHAPEATEEWVKAQAESDRSRNPHGDSYKPARRSYAELRACARYDFAQAMVNEKRRRERL